MKTTGEIRKRFYGNIALAQEYTGLARKLLGEMKLQMAIGGLQQLTRTCDLPGGMRIKVSSVFGNDEVGIYVPEVYSAQNYKSSFDQGGEDHGTLAGFNKYGKKQPGIDVLFIGMDYRDTRSWLEYAETAGVNVVGVVAWDYGDTIYSGSGYNYTAQTEYYYYDLPLEKTTPKEVMQEIDEKYARYSQDVLFNYFYYFDSAKMEPYKTVYGVVDYTYSYANLHTTHSSKMSNPYGEVIGALKSAKWGDGNERIVVYGSSWLDIEMWKTVGNFVCSGYDSSESFIGLSADATLESIAEIRKHAMGSRFILAGYAGYGSFQVIGESAVEWRQRLIDGVGPHTINLTCSRLTPAYGVGCPTKFDYIFAGFETSDVHDVGVGDTPVLYGLPEIEQRKWRAKRLGDAIIKHSGNVERTLL